MKRAAILIDGGYLRVLARRAGFTYDPKFIRAFAASCVLPGTEEIFRILYYDCPPYEGQATLRVSGSTHVFASSAQWLKELARMELFAVRLGVLKFRGFKPKTGSLPVNPTDADFVADFEQKGVDMRIGLDIATFGHAQSVDRIILVSNDTDCIPAMKYGRKSGLQVVLVELPKNRLAPELLEHADFRRQVSWPTP